MEVLGIAWVAMREIMAHCSRFGNPGAADAWLTRTPTYQGQYR